MQIINSQVCLQDRLRFMLQLVKSWWLVPEGTYVSIAALKPLEKRFLKSESY